MIEYLSESMFQGVVILRSVAGGIGCGYFIVAIAYVEILQLSHELHTVFMTLHLHLLAQSRVDVSTSTRGRVTRPANDSSWRGWAVLEVRDSYLMISQPPTILNSMPSVSMTPHPMPNPIENTSDSDCSGLRWHSRPGQHFCIEM